MTGPGAVRRAVVDRIADGLAVLLGGPDEQEHHLDAAHLPAGAGEGAWLLVSGTGDDLQVVGHDTDGEADRRAENEERIGRIRRTRRGGRFDRDG